MKRFKKVAIISLIGLFLIALPVLVFAGTKEKSIYVGPDEIIEGNFIRAGATVNIEGAVNGDVIVAGSSVTINGPVAGDVIAIANTIIINGTVGGSVRVIGSSVVINNEVAHNVWAVGNTVSLGNESKVGWDLYSAGVNVEANGPVGGNIWAAGTSITIGDEVGKDVAVSIDADGEIILYPEAKVGGNLTFKAASEEQLILKEGAEVVGEVSKKAIAVPSKLKFDQFFSGLYLFIKIISLFSLLIIGLVLVSLVPKFALQVTDEMVKNPAKSLGWGLVYVILVPVAIILLMITVIGIPLGLMLMPLYGISLYVSKVLAGFTIGLLTLNNLSKEKKYKGTLIWPMVLGLVVFVILTSLPIVGFVVAIFLILWALGAAIQIKKEILKEFR